MKKENQLAAYTMAVGELFELVAKATADVSDGMQQKAAIKLIEKRMPRAIQGVRYYASAYFEKKPNSSIPYKEILECSEPIQLLFDVSANLVAIATAEMQDFCKSWDENSQIKVDIVESNLNYLEAISTNV